MINIYKLKAKSCQLFGFSLVEVILAVALFGLFASALIGLLINSYGSDLQAKELDQANFYAQEGLEAIWSIRRQAWNYLVNGTYGLTKINGYWQFQGSNNLLEDKYTRRVTISNACRDASANLVDCVTPGSTVDLHTKKSESVVTYNSINGISQEIKLVSYLTTWQSKDFIQTDWSGGPGQVIWLSNNRFDSDDGNLDFGAAGQIKLVNLAANWQVHPDSGLTANDFNAIFGVAQSDVWAVGSGGKIYHYNGINWSQFIDTGNQTWSSVYFVSPTDGWVVGSSGQIYHYNGTNWSLFQDTGNQTWNSVYWVSSTDGWIGSGNGQIYHYNGVNWSSFGTVGGINWNSIFMISPTDGWVIGNGGLIYHFDGSQWQQAVSPTAINLSEIFMISSGRGWIVGSAGTILWLSAIGYKTSGYLISSAFNTGNASAFNLLSWLENIPAGSFDIQVQLATAPDAGGAPGTWSSWLGPTGAGSFYQSGQEILIPVSNNHNDDQWVKYKVILTGDGSNTPVLEEIKINYTP